MSIQKIEEFAALSHLRRATHKAHRRLEARFNAVEQLTDLSRRPAILHRYAALYVPAFAALKSELEAANGLGSALQIRASQLAVYADSGTLPAFPRPRNYAEALGLFYVIEGSSLGGRIILRELRAKGVTTAQLDFLDPYGCETGDRWRSLLDLIEKEAARGRAYLQSMTQGAVLGFLHAERVLCGEAF